MFYKKVLVSNDHTMDRSLTWSSDFKDLHFRLQIVLLALDHGDSRATDVCLLVPGVNQHNVFRPKNKYLDTNDYAIVI
jgi:hypothetical protein